MFLLVDYAVKQFWVDYVKKITYFQNQIKVEKGLAIEKALKGANDIICGLINAIHAIKTQLNRKSNFAEKQR